MLHCFYDVPLCSETPSANVIPDPDKTWVSIQALVTKKPRRSMFCVFTLNSDLDTFVHDLAILCH